MAEAGINAVGGDRSRAAAGARPHARGLVSHAGGGRGRHGLRGQRPRLRAGAERAALEHAAAGIAFRSSRCRRPPNLPTQTAVRDGGERLPPASRPDRALPAGIKHVVLIVKENRTYDEVFGESQGTMGAPELARFGTRGYVDGQRQRVSLRDVNVTPNHHAMARAVGDQRQLLRR